MAKAIPASYIVSVNPRVIYGASGTLVMSGLLLTDNALCPFPQLLAFPGADEVGEYFGVDTPEYRLATKYFLGFDNSYRKPEKLYFARRCSTAFGGGIIGSAVTAGVADFTDITNGCFKISVDGTAYTITGVDFSSATSYSTIAQAVQNALTTAGAGVTIEYSSVTKGFLINNATTGAEGTLSYVTADNTGTDISSMLKLTEADGAVLFSGSGVLTPAEVMESVEDQTQNFVSFTCVTSMTQQEALGYAAWTNSKGVSYLFSAWDSSSAASAILLKTAIETNGYAGTSVIYGSAEYAVFIMAEAASIDWNRRQGVINFAFKHQQGLAAVVIDGAEASLLEAGNVNFYGRWATRNPEFMFLYNGKVSGDYRYLDAWVNAIWLRSAIQISCMDGMTIAGRVPYTEAGYTQIKAWLQDPINTALLNGVIDAGVVLSEKQKAELYVEAGEDISETLFTEGYFVQVEDPGAAVRADRGTPIINVWYTYGGSVNKLNVPMTAFM